MTFLYKKDRQHFNDNVFIGFRQGIVKGEAAILEERKRKVFEIFKKFLRKIFGSCRKNKKKWGKILEKASI